MKRLVIGLAIVTLGMEIGLILFVVLGQEKESGEKISMIAKMEPIVDNQEELSFPQIGKLFEMKAMEAPLFLEARASFPKKRDAGPIEEALIEVPMKAKTEVTASEEDP
jgi:hypothetical protein